MSNIAHKYPSGLFQRSHADNKTFARERGFGTLILNGPSGILVSHVPFIVEEGQQTFEMHISNTNPMAEILNAPAQGMLSILGANGYVSPDWYGMGSNQVSTWDYVAVHIRGILSKLDHRENAAHVDRLSAEYEARLSPKVPWTTAKMDQEYFGKLASRISVLSLSIEQVEGIWKLGQNKPADARAAVANEVLNSPIGLGQADLSSYYSLPLR